MAAKILVTGANGFIGKALCRRLINLGHDVLALSRDQQDLTQPFQLNGDFDFVFHLGAHNITHVGNNGADLYQRVNVEGTRNVLNAVKARHFIFLSTAKVYQCEGKSILENSPVCPVHDYEKSKFAAETICRELRDSNSLLIFRCVNIVGYGQPAKAVIPVLFQKALAHEPMDILGPRDLVLQFLFVEDAVDAFVKVIEKKQVSGILNLSSDENITLGELAGAIKELCNSHSEIRFMNQDKVKFSPVVATKAENALNWKAQTSIKAILDSYRRGESDFLKS